MGIRIFMNGEFERAQEGYLMVSDFSLMDRKLDRRLIEYLLQHMTYMSDRQKKLTMRRFGFSELPKEDPDEAPSHRIYLLLVEQVQRENDYEILRKAALHEKEKMISYMAFCRLTGFRRPPSAGEDDGYGFCGLKNDILREDVEDLCREMIDTRGPFDYEARQWLEFLPTVSDETMAAWALPNNERRKRVYSSDPEIRKLLEQESGNGSLSGEELEDRIRGIYDAYILMIYEEQVEKLTRKKKRESFSEFTLRMNEIIRCLRRDMITDAAEAVRGVLVTGHAMPQDLQMEDIRRIMLSESKGDHQHSRFLRMAGIFGL